MNYRFWPLSIVTAYVFFIFVIDAATGGASAGAVVFAPSQCTHQVTFPRPPEIKRIRGIVPGIEVDQANMYLSDAFLRAECIPGIIKEKDAIAWLLSYASNEGLKGFEFTIERRSDGKYFLGRGKKTVGKIPVTYKLILVISEASIMAVVVGGVSTN